MNLDENFAISDLDFTNSDNLPVSEIKTEDEQNGESLFFPQLFNAAHQYAVVNECRDNNNESGSGNSTFQFSNMNNGSTDVVQYDAFDKNFFKLENGNPHFIKHKTMDGKNVKIFSCGICFKEFGHQYTLMRHLPTHTDERKFQCNTCGKAFRQMSTLSQHRAIHSSERPYICEICQKTFNRVSTLISHRKTHTGMKPHKCHLCNKAFHQKGNLRNHIFTHTNERPYKCDICDKGFNQMSNLMCHKLKAHQRADKPKYSCRICGQDFPKRVNLRNHEQNQHGLGQNVETSPEKLLYSNAIIVDPIKTDAMKLAIQSSQTPFALLRPLTGIPVLVRVLPAGDKQMLVPATAEDLKKHGQISIIPKLTNEQHDSKTNNIINSAGSTVQIRIPVVATVIQQNGSDGMSMSIVSPGPNGEVVNKQECTSRDNNSFIYTSTLTSAVQDKKETAKENDECHRESRLVNSEIEFLDSTGNMIPEEEFHDFNMINGNLDIGFSSNHCMQSEHDDLSSDCITMDLSGTGDDDSSQYLLPSWTF